MINPSSTYQTNQSYQDQSIDALQKIQNSSSGKLDKLKKASCEFESVLLTQMFEIMDSTVERSGFLSNGKNEKMFKSLMFQEVSKNIASNPATSIGLAKQIYEQTKDRI